jgi:hypothetical protein
MYDFGSEKVYIYLQVEGERERDIHTHKKRVGEVIGIAFK